MKTLGFQLKIVLLILSITVFLAGCAPVEEPTKENISKIKEAITAVSEARAQAFNNSNAEGIAMHFTPNAILMAPGKPATKGRDSVRAYYQSIFDEFEPELDSYYKEIDVSGDIAYGRGVATVKLTSKDGGKPITSTSKYLNILKRQPDGTWKTTHDIWNSNE